MGWVTQSYVYYDASGKKRVGTKKVWVPEPKPAVKPDRAGDDAADMAAARKRALDIAAREAAKKKAAEARKRAMEAAKERAKQVRAQLAPPTMGSGPQRAIDKVTVGDIQDLNQKKADDAYSARYTALGDYYKRQAKRASQIKRAKSAKAGDTSTAKWLEREVARIRAEQKASGDKTLDPEYVQIITEAYQKHVQATSNRYKRKVDELRSYFKVDPKTGALIEPKDDESARKAWALYNSRGFKTIESEYNRLFGSGKDQGTFVPTMGLRDEIGKGQRFNLYNMARDVVLTNARALSRRDREDRAEGKALIEEWEKTGKFNFYWEESDLKDLIKPDQTGWTTKLNENGVPERVRRTVEEEFEYQKGLYYAEMNRRAAEYRRNRENQIARNKLMAGIEAPTKEEARDQKMIASAIQRSGVQSIEKPEDIQKVINLAMEEWDKSYKSLYITEPKTQGGTYAPGVTSPRYEQIARYNKAREEAEKRLYATLGAEAPGILDRMFMPGSPLKGPMDILSAPFGAIGAASKYTASVLTGKPAEWMLESKNFGYKDLPHTMKAQVDAEAKRIFEANKNTTLGTTGQKPTMEWAIARAIEKIVYPWMETPSGQAWVNENDIRRGGIGINTGQNAKDKQRLYDELLAFYNKYNVQGGSGDIGAMVDALGSSYAQSPFSPYGGGTAANLLAGLAFDPTNAIPLKATTYAARARYALEASQGRSILKKPLVFAHRWTTVTEPQLRLEKYARKAKKLVAAGKDPSEAVEEILMSVSKMTDPRAKRQAIEEWGRRIGLSREDANTHQLMSLVEESLTARFAEAGVDYKSAAEEAAKRLKDREAAKVAAEAERRMALAEADKAAAAQADAAKARYEAGKDAADARRAAEAEALAARAARPAPVRPPEVEVVRAEPEPAPRRHPEPEQEALSVADEKQIKTLMDDAGIEPAPVSKVGEEHHGVFWEPGTYDAFKVTPEGQALLAKLDATFGKKGMTLDEAKAATANITDAKVRSRKINKLMEDQPELVPDRRGVPAAQKKVDAARAKVEKLKRALPDGADPDIPVVDAALREDEALRGFRSQQKVLKAQLDQAAKDVNAAIREHNAPRAASARARYDRILNNGRAIQKKINDRIAYVDAYARELRAKRIAAAERELALAERDLTAAEGLVSRRLGPDLETRAAAQREIYETARRMAAEKILALESAPGGIPLVGPPGRQTLNWEKPRFTDVTGADSGGRRVTTAIQGGPSSAKQYIATASDISARAGAKTVNEAAEIAMERVAFEEAKLRLLTLQRAVDNGSITPEQFDELVKSEVESLAVMTDAEGASLLYHRSPGEVDPYSVMVGHALVKDAIVDGRVVPDRIRYTYETFSLLPGHGIVSAENPDAFASPLMTKVMSQPERKAMTRRDFANMIRSNWAHPPVGPTDFRERAQPLFALFHMVRLDGDLDSLREFSKSIDVLLDRDPQNLFGRMWRVMESRTGVPWARPFDESEGAFKAACLRTTTEVLSGSGKALRATSDGVPVSLIHPNLALAMVPYGPFARQLPQRFGFQPKLDRIPYIRNPLFATAPIDWGDKEVLDAMAAINEGTGTAEDLIRTASQAISYIAGRYGNVTRRQAFVWRVQDGMIWNSIGPVVRKFGVRGLNEFPWIDMKALYKEIVEARAGRRLLGDAAANGFNRAVLKAVEDKARLVGGKARQAQFNDDMRDAYYALYWEGKITHKNPALHTMNLFMTLQERGAQFGDQWTHYVSAYRKHMADAGFKDLGDTVVRELFPSYYQRAASHAVNTAYDSSGAFVSKMDSIDAVFGDMLPSFDRVAADQRARKLRNAEDLAAREDAAEVARQADIDEAFADDDSLRAAREKDGTPAAYAFGSLEQTTMDLTVALRLHKKIVPEAEALIAAVDLPPDKHLFVRGVMKRIREVVRENGGWVDPQKIKFVSKRGRQYTPPPEVMQVAVQQLRIEYTRERILRHLSLMVRRTMDVRSLTQDMETALQRAVALVKLMPDGDALLIELARRQGVDLWASRLGDYIRHEDYFKFIEKPKVEALPGFTLTPEQTSRLNALRKRSDAAQKKLHVGSPAERARARTIYDKVNEQIREIEKHGYDARDAKVKEREAARNAAGAPPETAPYGVSATYAPEAPAAPSPAELNDAGRSMAERALEILSGMSEEKWYARELDRARRIWKTTKDPLAKKAAFERMEDANKALKVLEVRKSGGSYIPPASRKAHANRIFRASKLLHRQYFNPKQIAPYVTGRGGLRIEQGRVEYRLLMTAPVDDTRSLVPMAGKTTEYYQKHGKALESVFSRKIPRKVARDFGLPEAICELNPLEILTSADELDRLLKNPQFTDFLNFLGGRMDRRVREISGSRDYSLSMFLADRLSVRGDHYPNALWEEHHRIVSDAIAEARGARRSSLTDLRRKRGAQPENPLVEMTENALVDVIAKAKALNAIGADAHSYNEARKVLRRAWVQKHAGEALVGRAAKKAIDELDAAGKRIDDPDYQDAYREAYDRHFLEERQKLADLEADKKLKELAGEMPGAKPSDVMEEFRDRYAMDGQVRGFEPGPITTFQKNTLEDAVKSHLGIDDVRDQAQVIDGLSRFGQAPPFNHRGRMKAWLQKYGIWSPRTGDEIDAGERTWSIFEEADYYRTNWGFTPDWANPDLYMDGAPRRTALFDEDEYKAMMMNDGLFNQNMEGRFATGKLSRDDRVKLLAEGNAEMKLNPKRDLELERRYVIQRFGSLVTDEQGNLIAFPWLMKKAELRQYLKATSSKAIAGDLIDSPEQLAALERAIEKHIGRYFDESVMAGKTVEYPELLNMAVNIVHDLLEDPVWLKRGRDTIGDTLRLQAKVRRLLVFSQLGFATANVVDSGIKGAWSAFTTRSFMSATISPKAANMTLFDFGLDRGTQLLTDMEAHGTARIREARRNPVNYDPRKLLAVAEGALEIPAEIAAGAENAAKLRLARGMYDKVYDQMLKKLGDPALADAAARDFIANEVKRLWPTVGDGYAEKFFNMLVPFASYQLKNRFVFIGELVSHPAFFNYFDKIGDYIESVNREQWAKDHPEDPEASGLPENLARMIKMPWGDVFFDFGSLSDASRGLKPIFDIAGGKALSYRDFAAYWIRLAGPQDQNIIGGILNAMGVPMRYGHEPILDKDGNIIGYRLVEQPWEAPWGGTANAANSFWPIELMAEFAERARGKFTVEDISMLVGQLLFMGGLKELDKGASLSAFYFAMRDRDPDYADKWLNETNQGRSLQAYWRDRRTRVRDAFIPTEIKNMYDPPKFERSEYSKQPQEWKDQVKASRSELAVVMKKWDRVIAELTPGTPEYREAKLQAMTARYNFYRTHPELYEAAVLGMSVEDWRAFQDQQQLDAKVQTFFNLPPMPDRDKFSSAAEYQKALREWRAVRDAYLKANPDVARVIGTARDQVDAVWRATEAGWFDVLDRVGTRQIAIEAAKQQKDYDLLDQLYLANELDFKTLDEDVAVEYFDPTTDFQTMPKGTYGPPALVSPDLLTRVKVLPDFTSWRFSRMNEGERAEFERTNKYVAGMKDVIAAAKASGKFNPATFVRELKKNPWLLREYFRRNPGKEAKWKANDEYIRIIGRFGQLMKAGKFDEGYRYFDSMPAWVKDRYYAKHPDRRQKAVQNAEYTNWMKRWTDFYRRRDYAGGAAFFARMPAWVKDQYYSKHPQNQYKGTSAYAKAMGKWVKMLQDGDKEGAKKYFDSLPQAYKERYYAKHPEQRLRNDVKRTGQLAEYFAADDAGRARYLKENPEFARWLRANDNSATDRRMLILAAYAAVPKEDQWLRRIFREQYPEVFSAEAKGELLLKKTWDFLGEHPDMLPSFEKWVEAVWASYAENLKHSKSPPLKMIEADHSRVRNHGLDVDRPHRGRSAAWVRLHSSG